MAYEYYIGSTTVKVNSINEAREMVEEIRNLADESSSDLSKHLSDFCFAVEVDYQKYHNLDPDNWGMAHK